MTKLEACLWKYVLRAGKMKGYGFRRQRPIMNYIADFMCKELMLVIEVDGFSHWNNEAKNEDAQREKVLLLAGFNCFTVHRRRSLKQSRSSAGKN